MSRPPPYYPMVPTNMMQPNYQQVEVGTPVMAQQTSQVPQMSQPTANGPTVFLVENNPGTPAWISTDFGRFQKRKPIAGVARILRSNEEADVKAMAASLRQKYPELTRTLTKPTGWDALYTLWDAADIQMQTPGFLYYVMHQLGEENEKFDQLDREAKEQLDQRENNVQEPFEQRNREFKEQLDQREHNVQKPFEQQMREFKEKQHHEIDVQVQEWVANNRESVLISHAGSMYGLFCSDISADNDFAPELKPIISNILETHRLRLLRETSGYSVNATVPPRLLQSHSMPPNLPHQGVNAPHPRAVSDTQGLLSQSGNQVNGQAMPIVSGSRSNLSRVSRVNPESSHVTTHAQSTPVMPGGRIFSMPSNSTILANSASANQADNVGHNSTAVHQAQTYDHFMENQRNMTTSINTSTGINALTGLNASPTNPNGFRTANGFATRHRPRENSIETPRNRRQQWTGPQGSHPNKPPHQWLNNNQQMMSPGRTRGSPSRGLQPEPIYVRNFDHNSVPIGDTVSQRMVNDGLVGSRMGLPNDARKTFQNSKFNQSVDLGVMEGDPRLSKTDNFCEFKYDASFNAGSGYGRTLYLRGPDLKMFHTHQLKDLMSTVGKVMHIKYLLRGPFYSGPVFVTFETDVLEHAIEKFNNYKMRDGLVLMAGYPYENSRERSGSNSSYNGYRGDNQTRYMPNARSDNHNRYTSNSGSDGRTYSRRNSISQHRPSRSQSGQTSLRYPNGNQMTSGNVYKTLSLTSDPQAINSYSVPFASVAYQQPFGHPIGAAFSEVVQHESAIARFQQQMPLAVIDNRANAPGPAHHRPYGRTQGESHRVNTKLEASSAMINSSDFPSNRKENSPIKPTATENTQSTPTRKNSSNNSGSKRKKKPSRENTSNMTTPTATPVKSLSQSHPNELHVEKSGNKTVEVASPEPLSIEIATGSKIHQLSTTETTAEPETINLKVEQVSVAVSEPPVSVSNPVSRKSSEATVKASESVSQGKIKNSKKNKKQFKSNNKFDTDKGNNTVNSTTAVLSPAESEGTSSSFRGESILSSGDSTREPSISSNESGCNDPLTDATPQSQSGTKESTKLVEREKPFAKLVASEVKYESISVDNGTSAPVSPNIPPAKSNHKRSKTGGSVNDSLSKSRSSSAKDLKKQSQSKKSDNHDSPTMATGPVLKAEPKIIKSQGKLSRDGTSKSSEQQEQSKADSTKKKRSSAETSREKGKTTVSVDPTDSSEWPALVPSKSPPSSIADGMPPQLPALPGPSFRRNKEVILPALPLKPHRISYDTLGSEFWPFVRRCKRKVMPTSNGG